MCGTSLVQEDPVEINALFSKINVLNDLCLTGPLTGLNTDEGGKKGHIPKMSLASEQDEKTNFS